ncbi:uncharacterized protein YjeT (DUF2065 family) [Bradyrhizobium sp. AZCC 1578]|uniref:hypothetical protein n=1 Tax=Bradyrhizobium sp. AZCC 1578 TaxID=3117027 RepID=UPI002FF3194D
MQIASKVNFTADSTRGSIMAVNRQLREDLTVVHASFLVVTVEKRGLFGMGMPQQWHRRHAMMLASQLPENSDDARLVVKAMTELLDTFMAKSEGAAPARAANVLPFAGSG